ncbi:MAG: hypothetical protein RL528_160 [Bacteroidota bacterium]|jgi:hypothetical protein
MLNSEYIHSKLTNIQTCSSEDAIHFASMIELYPYASSFSILYLKSLSNSKDIRFDSELEKHAFRIQSRSVLFDLLHNNNEEQQILIPEIIEIETQQEITSEELVIEEIENRDLELEKQILSAAFSANYVDKELTQIEPEVVSSEIIFLPTQEMLSTKKPEIDDLTSLSFGSWLKVNNSRAILSEEIDTEEPKQEFYTFEKPKKEFFSPVKKAKESVDENKMPVSETLARIFELQGNLPKAIYVYEQLSLIFPKKKTYFASQINLLKKK